MLLLLLLLCGCAGNGRNAAETLDGAYCYVANDVLLEQIAGVWESGDGHYALRIDHDGGIRILLDGSIVLEDALQFSYLQPGFVAGTEFTLSQWELTAPDGAALGTIDSLHHENGGLITLELEAPGGHKVIVFRSAQR